MVYNFLKSGNIGRETIEILDDKCPNTVESISYFTYQIVEEYCSK